MAIVYIYIYIYIYSIFVRFLFSSVPIIELSLACAAALQGMDSRYAVFIVVVDDTNNNESISQYTSQLIDRIVQ